MRGVISKHRDSASSARGFPGGLPPPPFAHARNGVDCHPRWAWTGTERPERDRQGAARPSRATFATRTKHIIARLTVECQVHVFRKHRTGEDCQGPPPPRNRAARPALDTSCLIPVPPPRGYCQQNHRIICASRRNAGSRRLPAGYRVTGPRENGPLHPWRPDSRPKPA